MCIRDRQIHVRMICRKVWQIVNRGICINQIVHVGAKAVNGAVNTAQRQQSVKKIGAAEIEICRMGCPKAASKDGYKRQVPRYADGAGQKQSVS